MPRTRTNKSQFVVRKTCPLCKADDSSCLCEISFDDDKLKLFIEDYYQGRVSQSILTAAVFRVMQCRQCELIYQQQVLNDKSMIKLYDEWIDHQLSLEKKQNANAGLFRRYAGQMQTIQRLFTERPAEIRILDYGMGWGYWSRMAQAHGFVVSGYEISRPRLRHARSMGLNVIKELPAAGPHYQFIYVNQVFEHVPDPLQCLRDLCERLAPGGVIQIRAPDGRGVAEYLQQRGWSAELNAIHPLEHINCFTRRSLIRLGSRAGLKPFNPPLRLHWGSLWGGLKREIADRFQAPHIYFKRDHKFSGELLGGK